MRNSKDELTVVSEKKRGEEKGTWLCHGIMSGRIDIFSTFVCMYGAYACQANIMGHEFNTQAVYGNYVSERGRIT